MLQMFRSMAEIRAFEYRAYELYREGVMRGTTHAYVGEEAIAVGVCAALRQDDTITSTHRGHGHCIAKGGDMSMMMAELLGKETGYSGGKGGSMHIADVDKGILGANGIVGGGMGIATGAGLSAKLLGNGRVSVCFFGDGALNQGILHESMNLAADLEAAGRLRLREQPVRDVGAGPGHDGRGRPVRPRRGLRHPRRRTSTAWTCWPSSGPPARPSSGRGPARARASSSPRPTASSGTTSATR